MDRRSRSPIKSNTEPSSSSRSNSITMQKRCFFVSNSQMIADSLGYPIGPGPGKYARSSSIGHLNHDVTLIRYPAFTIGKATRQMTTRQITPGPGAYAYEKYSNPFKKSIPAFSIPKARRFTHVY